MSLAAGTRLGSYEILAPLGAGGMGEVYRARDTKLGREVALKSLPESFTRDPERVARFRREAQMLASLNHPHIAQIHGLDDADGTQFLVLELVDGECLDKRIGRGPIPVVEALGIATQIAEALQAAHDKGIIHRDLKPANIALASDGRAKVLDFGLAKADEATAGSFEAANSPTITSPAMMTSVGMILGTAAYMAPEQAKGQPADKRSDIWAFGCVMYEMLSGKRAFDGDDVSDVLATVLKREPDWSALPGDTPWRLRTVLHRCLAKDRQVRISDVSVIRFVLDERDIETSTARGAQESFPIWTWVAATLCVTAIGVLVAVRAVRSTPAPMAKFFVAAPEKTMFVAGARMAASPAISPDGRMLAFTARDATGNVMLWVRPIDALIAQPLAGTEGAAFPFWSPDSLFIGYMGTAKLFRIAVAGGPPQAITTLTSSILGRGATWGRDGTIVYSSAAGMMYQVSSSGGDSQPAKPGGGAFPSFLPDGRHLLYYKATGVEEQGIFGASLESGEAIRIATADSAGIFDARSGRLLFVRQGTLMSQPFNPKTMALADEPVPIADGVQWGGAPQGLPSFSVSPTGVLVYGTGVWTASVLQLVWVDRQGKAVGTVGPPGNYRGIDLSPDGTRVAAYRFDGQGGDVWVTDVPHGTTSRFTFDASQVNSSPIWSPDGTQIAYASSRAGKWGIYRKASNGHADDDQLLESGTQVLPVSWSPDGRFIVFDSAGEKTMSAGLWVLPLTRDRKPMALTNPGFQESHAQISPNGKWIAYESFETGRMEIYVRPFPVGVGKWQISTNSGQWPRWRHDGRELFYMGTTGLIGYPAAGGKLMAVDVNSEESTFEFGPPHELFESGYLNLAGSGHYHTFAVSPDGRRFLIPRPQSAAVAVESPPLAVVLNWSASLNK